MYGQWYKREMRCQFEGNGLKFRRKSVRNEDASFEFCCQVIKGYFRFRWLRICEVADRGSEERFTRATGIYEGIIDFPLPLSGGAAAAIVF